MLVPHIPTEAEIERYAEKTMDRLDKYLLEGSMSSEEYSHAILCLDCECKRLLALRLRYN